MAVQIDLTTLSGYESLAAGTYALAVKSKASGYTDSDLSSTVNFTKLAAPVVTAADTTVSWDAVTNAESYDVYVDGELYENTTGGYDITVNVTNGTYTGDTSISNTATITITADSGYKLPDTVTVTGASQNWNKETGTLTLSNPTGAVTVSSVCVAVQTGETWVLNETLTGNNFDISEYSGLSFTAGPYTGYGLQWQSPDLRSYYLEDDSFEIFWLYANGFSKDYFRTITFSEPVTDSTLLAWLQANGTKQ